MAEDQEIKVNIGTTPMPEFRLSPREELAVICERLKAHVEDTKDESARVRLDIARDIIRAAIFRR